jgi:hypothetical protein
MYKFEGFDGERQQLKNAAAVMPRHKSMAAPTAPFDHAVIDQDKFGHVLSKINRFLKQ